MFLMAGIVFSPAIRVILHLQSRKPMEQVS